MFIVFQIKVKTNNRNEKKKTDYFNLKKPSNWHKNRKFEVEMFHDQRIETFFYNITTVQRKLMKFSKVHSPQENF